jgi:LAGLIDADG DNA endonuclease family protein
VKVVPMKIEEILSPVSLAYWAMDDGNKQGKGFHLNTHSFMLEEVE